MDGEIKIDRIPSIVGVCIYKYDRYMHRPTD